eukprot:GDKK01004502.1.p1 GENE.GDKK01004502.1~~GDKK01004502.1.p1  ORF type:complete len:108 (+),score=11.74 GDKK01004502.1:505-828(+)
MNKQISHLSEAIFKLLQMSSSVFRCKCFLTFFITFDLSRKHNFLFSILSSTFLAGIAIHSTSKIHKFLFSSALHSRKEQQNIHVLILHSFPFPHVSSLISSVYASTM